MLLNELAVTSQSFLVNEPFKKHCKDYFILNNFDFDDYLSLDYLSGVTGVTTLSIRNVLLINFKLLINA